MGKNNSFLTGPLRTEAPMLELAQVILLVVFRECIQNKGSETSTLLSHIWWREKNEREERGWRREGKNKKEREEGKQMMRDRLEGELQNSEVKKES